MLSLEAHLGVTASPQAPFPTDYVTLPVSASHRRFGSLPLAAEEGHAPALHYQLLRGIHSKHAQAALPPYGRATLAGRTIGHIRTPHLVGTRNRNTSQQIRINLVLRMGLTCLGTRGHPRQAHHPHQSLYPLAVHLMTQTPQYHDHSPRIVKRMSRILSINQATQTKASLRPKQLTHDSLRRLSNAPPQPTGIGDSLQTLPSHQPTHALSWQGYPGLF